MEYVIVICLGYLLGSIPFGYLLTKLAGLGDIRAIGSGNIGATNVLRTGHKGLAALTLLLDGLKGAAAVLLAEKFFADAGTMTAITAALAALLGHMFPVWLKFRGGKGVATTVGIVTALAWPIGLVTMGLWILIAAVFRYSSLAALVAIGLLPLDGLIFKRPEVTWLAVVIVFLVFFKHGENIKRLFEGTETKIGRDKNAAPSA